MTIVRGFVALCAILFASVSAQAATIFNFSGILDDYNDVVLIDFYTDGAMSITARRQAAGARTVWTMNSGCLTALVHSLQIMMTLPAVQTMIRRSAETGVLVTLHWL